MSCKNTSNILTKIRNYMRDTRYVKTPLSAYLIPSGDAHQSEYIADHDQRRAFISGFTGSSGTAIITLSQSALWTDGRYHLQAKNQLDDNWILMKDGIDGTPTQVEWLVRVLKENDIIGFDPFLLSFSEFKKTKETLLNNGIYLTPIPQNLVDLVWNDVEEQPPIPTCPVYPHPMKYTGKSSREKVDNIRQKMKEKHCDMLVVTALDEIAWLLNLRGSDIPFNPCFFSYVILTNRKLLVFIDIQKLTIDSKNNLNNGLDLVEFHPYDHTFPKFSELVQTFQGKVWINDSSSYALFDVVPIKRLFVEPSPIALMKCIKNDVEINGMKKSHVKDAVAMCEFISFLEKKVKSEKVTELSASEYLKHLRSQQKDFISLSFETISAVGQHGAIIHYRSTQDTDSILTSDEIYLVDSGAQYLDGTTDITRTLHFDTPSHYEQECFTRVLKGHIALASTIFPNRTYGYRIDAIARVALWEAGLDYLHGTGHGVGSFLNVHEGPCSISYRPRSNDAHLEEGMIVSIEPGYYESNRFGIRIESLFLIQKSNSSYNFNNVGFLTFQPITLVPLQTKMIIPEMLSEKEINWLNQYHQTCYDIIGEELKRQNKMEIHNWLFDATRPIG